MLNCINRIGIHVALRQLRCLLATTKTTISALIVNTTTDVVAVVVVAAVVAVAFVFVSEVVVIADINSKSSVTSHSC